MNYSTLKIDNKHLECAGNKARWESDTMELIINPTDICNFNCKYCCNVGSRKKNILDKNIMTDFITDLAAKNKEKYIFRITGGEPLLYPHKEEMVKLIAQIIPGQRNIKFITNGSLIHKEYKKLKKYYSDIKIEYIISLHLDQIDIGSFIENLKSIPERENIICKILIAPGKLEVYKKIYNIFFNLGLPVITDGLFDAQHDPLVYNNDEIDFINEHSLTDHFIFHQYNDGRGGTYTRPLTRFDKRFQPDLHSYKGMHCCAGLNTLHLNPRGILIPCFGLGLQCGEKYDLGKSRLKDLEALSSPRICSVDRCVCGQFIKTPKWRGNKNMPKYLR